MNLSSSLKELKENEEIDLVQNISFDDLVNIFRLPSNENLKRRISTNLDVEEFISKEGLNEVVINILSEMCVYRDDIHTFINDDMLVFIIREMLKSEQSEMKVASINLFRELCHQDIRCLPIVHEIAKGQDRLLRGLSFNETITMFSHLINSNFINEDTVNILELLFQLYFKRLSTIKGIEYENQNENMDDQEDSDVDDYKAYNEPNYVGIFSLLQATTMLLCKYDYDDKKEEKNHVENILVNPIEILIHNTNINAIHIHKPILMCLREMKTENINKINDIQDYIKQLILEIQDDTVFNNCLKIVINNSSIWKPLGYELVNFFLTFFLPKSFEQDYESNKEEEGEYNYFSLSFTKKKLIFEIIQAFFSEEISHDFYPIIFHLLFQLYESDDDSIFCNEVLKFSCILLTYENECATLFDYDTISTINEMCESDDSELQITATFLIDKINSILEDE